MRKRLRSIHRLKADLVSEINVTPFVDILLVLLIAFMISAPLLTHSINIQLPQGEYKETAPTHQEKPLIVTVDQKQNILIDDQKYSFAQLRKSLREKPQKLKTSPVYLQMDRRVPHGFLVKLMLLFKSSGFQQVGLVFEEIPKP